MRRERRTTSQPGRPAGNLQRLVPRQRAQGEALGPGLGGAEEEQAAPDAAFEDARWDTQGPLALSEVPGGSRGGGKRKRAEGRGQVSNPRSGGTGKRLQMERRGGGGKFPPAAWGRSTDGGREPRREEGGQSPPVTDSIATAPGWAGGALSTEDRPLLGSPRAAISRVSRSVTGSGT